MTVELMTSGSEPGFDDYDAIYIRNRAEIFSALSQHSDHNERRRNDKTGLPYPDEFVTQNKPTTAFDAAFLRLLHDPTDGGYSTTPMRRGLLLGLAISDQLGKHGASVTVDMAALRQYSQLGEYQVDRLLAITERYQRVRPQLNQLIDHFVSIVIPETRHPEKYRNSGKMVANFVLWQSEEVALSKHLETQAGILVDEIEVAGISGPDQLIDLWGKSPKLKP